MFWENADMMVSFSQIEVIARDMYSVSQNVEKISSLETLYTLCGDAGLRSEDQESTSFSPTNLLLQIED